MKWALLFLVACGSAPPHVSLTEQWPAKAGEYKDVTKEWARAGVLRGQYQEVLSVWAVFKSPDWRAAHAEEQAEDRKLEGPARDAVRAQAQADMAGPYEVELMATTWDRKENDFDRGKRSVWRVVLVDDQGREIEPLEIVRDKRPPGILRADFPMFGDFAQAYVARFPRTEPLLGPAVKQLRLRVSSDRGGIELDWDAP